MTYTTTKEAARTIRAALKSDLGLNSKKVSVRIHNYSMGSSIYVTIKATGVDFDKVEEIANRASSIRYCEASGEILSGGNRFVNTSLDSNCAPIAARAALLLPIIEQVTGDTFANIGDLQIQKDHTDWPDGFRTYHNDVNVRGMSAYDAESCAKQTAKNLNTLDDDAFAAVIADAKIVAPNSVAPTTADEAAPTINSNDDSNDSNDEVEECSCCGQWGEVATGGYCNDCEAETTAADCEPVDKLVEVESGIFLPVNSLPTFSAVEIAEAELTLAEAEVAAARARLALLKARAAN